MKKWYKSKTLWFNVATVLIAAGNELAPLLELMEAEAAESARVLIIMASSVGNTVLRIVTNTKVTM